MLYRNLANRSELFAHSATARDPEQWRNVAATLGIGGLRQPWLELDRFGYAPPSSERYRATQVSEAAAFTVDAEAVERLLLLRDELHARGIELLILLLPVTDDWNDRYVDAPDLNGAFQDFDVLDLQHLSEERFFRDPNHANTLGATTVTRALASDAALCGRVAS